MAADGGDRAELLQTLEEGLEIPVTATQIFDVHKSTGIAAWSAGKNVGVGRLSASGGMERLLELPGDGGDDDAAADAGGDGTAGGPGAPRGGSSGKASLRAVTLCDAVMSVGSPGSESEGSARGGRSGSCKSVVLATLSSAELVVWAIPFDAGSSGSDELKGPALSMASPTRLARVRTAAAAVRDVAWHPHRATLAVCMGTAVQLLHIDPGEAPAAVVKASSLPHEAVLSGEIKRCAWSEDGHTLCVAGSGEVAMLHWKGSVVTDPTTVRSGFLADAVGVDAKNAAKSYGRVRAIAPIKGRRFVVATDKSDFGLSAYAAASDETRTLNEVVAATRQYQRSRDRKTASGDATGDSKEGGEEAIGALDVGVPEVFDLRGRVGMAGLDAPGGHLRALKSITADSIERYESRTSAHTLHAGVRPSTVGEGGRAPTSGACALLHDVSWEGPSIHVQAVLGVSPAVQLPHIACYDKSRDRLIVGSHGCPTLQVVNIDHPSGSLLSAEQTVSFDTGMFPHSIAVQGSTVWIAASVKQASHFISIGARRSLVLAQYTMHDATEASAKRHSVPTAAETGGDAARTDRAGASGSPKRSKLPPALQQQLLAMGEALAVDDALDGVENGSWDYGSTSGPMDVAAFARGAGVSRIPSSDSSARVEPPAPSVPRAATERANPSSPDKRAGSDMRDASESDIESRLAQVLAEQAKVSASLGQLLASVATESATTRERAGVTGEIIARLAKAQGSAAMVQSDIAAAIASSRR